MKTKNKIYICPMHPDIQSDSPGLCSECGMNLIKNRKSNTKYQTYGSKSGNHKMKDHDKHAGHSVNIFKKKFWVSFLFSIPIVAYSDIAQNFLNYRAPQFTGANYLQFVLASVIFFYGGRIFLVSAFREFKARLPGMMTLIALAISVAYFYSVGVTFIGRGEILFWELATLITIMLLGHWLEMRAVSGAQGALKELSKLLPDTAEIIHPSDGGQKTEIVSLKELRKEDILLVRPGGKIPADGIIKEGVSDINESIITGESKPVSKKEGDAVIAGSINGDGSLKIKIAKIGDETFLAGVMRLVTEAQSSKSRLQMLSDKAAFYLTIIALITGGVTFAFWLLVAEPSFAITRAVAVLVIACPHALGLAIPLVASISTTKAAKNGFLVKQRLALEAARNIDIVLFDKTGTLTKGEFGIYRIISVPGTNETEVLKYAASANSHSEHPLAKAMAKEVKNKNLPLLDIKEFQRIPGKGVRAKIDNEEIYVGSLSLLEDMSTSVPNELQREVDTLSGQGKTINVVLMGKKVLGVIALSDIVREESKEAIRILKNNGVKTAMITGDAEDVAKWVAEELGIDEYFAKVLPEQKSEKVKLLQAGGQKVAMVGDGVNDAPALMQSDLGIAIGAGTNIAIESAGIILVRNDPRDIAKIIRLSRLTYTKMIQNLFWATGYNIVALPLAAGLLAFKGLILQPALAALFMSLSTVIVAINAVFLRNKRI